jgi:hypothetical protein
MQLIQNFWFKTFTNGNSYGEADVWLPLWQSASSVAYADVRYQKDENTQWDFAAGGGYRWLSDDMERLYDIYGFYNSYNSQYNNQFQQVMGGGNFRTDNWTVRGNYYYSVGPTQYNIASLNTLTFAPTTPGQTLQNYGLLSYGYENNYINGGVIEIGRTIPYSAGLSLFGGYYGFASSDARPFVNGFRARAEYRLDEAFNFKTPFIRHITLESMYQYDNVYKGAFTVGARLDIPLGKSYTGSKLQDAMMDYVRFYPYAIQGNMTSSTPVIYTQDGMPWVFDVVNNLNDFDAAISDNSNVVVVNNNIQLDIQKNISSNKYITGQNFEYAPGKFINVTGKSAPTTVTGANENYILGVSQNNTIRDLNLILAGQPDYATYLYSAITNLKPGSSDSVGKLTIDNITTNGAVNISVGSASSSNSIISIINSTFIPYFVKLSNANFITAISIVGYAPVSISNIDNNTIDFSKNYNIPNSGEYFYETGIYLESKNNNTQQVNVGSVSNNHINFGDASLSRAIYIQNNSSSAQNIGSVNGNIIVYGKNIALSDTSIGGTYLRAIYILNGGTNNTANQTIDSVSNNQITFGGGLTLSHDSSTGDIASLFGINIDNSNSTNQSITSVNNNIITFSDVTLNSKGPTQLSQGGFALSGLKIFSSGPSQMVTSVDNNTVNFGSINSEITSGNGLSSVSGILFDMYNPVVYPSGGGPVIPISQRVTSLNNNTINFNGDFSVSNSTSASSILSGLFVKSYSGANQSQVVSSIDSNQVNFKSTASTSTGTNSYVSGFEFFNVGADIAALNGQPIQYAQQFSLTNNTVSFAGNSVGLNVYGYHINQSAWAVGGDFANFNNESTVNVTNFYGNKYLVSGSADVTNENAIFLLNSSNTAGGPTHLGTINIKINASGGSDLSAANNGMQYTESPDTGNNITITP